MGVRINAAQFHNEKCRFRAAVFLSFDNVSLFARSNTVTRTNVCIVCFCKPRTCTMPAVYFGDWAAILCYENVVVNVWLSLDSITLGEGLENLTFLA